MSLDFISSFALRNKEAQLIGNQMFTIFAVCQIANVTRGRQTLHKGTNLFATEKKDSQSFIKLKG